MSGIRRERQGPLAILWLEKARGNAIDEALGADLRRACAEMEADDGVRGVLLASAHPKLFCPGLDLVSLVELDRPRMERFMAAFGEMLAALYGLSKMLERLFSAMLNGPPSMLASMDARLPSGSLAEPW